jgi:hypothetical protein
LKIVGRAGSLEQEEATRQFGAAGFEKTITDGLKNELNSARHLDA